MSLHSIGISRSLFRIALLSFCMLVFLGVFSFFRNLPARYGIHNIGEEPRSQNPHLSPVETSPRVRLDLSEQECREVFPGAQRDVEEMVKRGKFAFVGSDVDYKGLVQGRIRDGKLYILSTAPDRVSEILFQRLSILQQIHRALITSPSSLPDTHFAFVINDSPKNNSWAFAQPNKASSSNIWLMPHFGFWAWPPHIGTMDSALSRISSVEEDVGSWDKKIDKVVWRGTPWFNPIGRPRLRQDLLKATKSKSWADVAALKSSSDGSKTNSLRIEEFCRYKYVVYTEGVTYSGRLPYHQACESVLLMAEMTWLTSTAWLVRPVVGEELIRWVEGEEEKGRPAFDGPAKQQPKEEHNPSSLPVAQPLLPKVSPENWKTANAIYVRPDFSDIGQTVLFLRKHPEIARHIARNQRDLVVGSGYLKEAAEVCYWRALIHGWASVAIVEQREWGNKTGERFESWVLKEVFERRERSGPP